MSDETPANDAQASPTCKDTRMIARALSRRWPIPEEMKEALIKRQLAIAIDPKVKPREATAAFRSLVAAEAQNQADAPAEQSVAVTVRTGVTNAMELMKDLSDEEIDKMAEALSVLDKLQRPTESAS